MEPCETHQSIQQLELFHHREANKETREKRCYNKKVVPQNIGNDFERNATFSSKRRHVYMTVVAVDAYLVRRRQ